jgi:hypothetical protein
MRFIDGIRSIARNSTLGRAILLSAAIAALIGFDILPANAVVCAAGVYRAGCVGPHGAAVVRRPAYYAPVYHHPYCYWRAGVRVCR